MCSYQSLPAIKEANEKFKLLFEQKKQWKILFDPNGFNDTYIFYYAFLINWGLDYIKYILNHGEDVNKFFFNCFTTIHCAIMGKNKKEVFEYLVEKGADLNKVDCYGNTPLINMILYNTDINIIEYLIEKGADINKGTLLKQTPLHYAVMAGKDIKYIKLFVNMGADINAKDNFGSTPFFYEAAIYNRIEVLEYFANNGAIVNIKNKIGYTAFLSAMFLHPSLEILNFFIKHDAITFNGETVENIYRMFFRNGNPSGSVLKLIIDSGVDVNIITSNYKSTPLHHAAQYKQKKEVFKVLLENGADANASNKYNDTPLHYATFFELDIEIIELLIKYGANVNALNYQLRTPLYNAVMKKLPVKVIELLINKGADVNAHDFKGRTPLYEAHKQKYPAAVRLLKKHGAKKDFVNIDNEPKINYAVIKSILEEDKYDIQFESSIRYIHEYVNSYKMEDTKGDNFLVTFLMNFRSFAFMTCNNQRLFTPNILIIYNALKGKIDINDINSLGVNPYIRSKRNVPILYFYNIIQGKTDFKKSKELGNDFGITYGIMEKMMYSNGKRFIDNSILKGYISFAMFKTENGNTNYHMQSLKSLLDNNFENISERNKNGWTPIFSAVFNNKNKETNELLFKNKVNVNDTDYFGNNLLFYSAK